MLHQLDCLADLLVRADHDELRHAGLLARLGAEDRLHGRRRRMPLEETVVEHPVVVEELREVVAAGVGDQRQDPGLRPEPPRDPERRPHRRPGGASGEDPLLARQPPCEQEGISVRDPDPLVDDLGVHRLRPAVFADSLDQIGVDVGLVLRGVDRPLGVGADDQDLGLALLEEAADARDGAAGPDRDHDCVELTAGLLPDLRPGHLVVSVGIRHVGVLVGLEAAGDLLGKPVGDRVVTLRRVRRDGGGADHDLGAVRAQQRDLLLAHLVGHHEDAAVALDRGRDREPDARVAGGRLDDRAARPEPSLPLGPLDHRQPDPVFHRAAGVQVLELREQGRRDVASQLVQPDDRRRADEVEQGRVLPSHRPKLRSRLPPPPAPRRLRLARRAGGGTRRPRPRSLAREAPRTRAGSPT